MSPVTSSCANSESRSTPPGIRMLAPRRSPMRSWARRRRDSDVSSFVPASSAAYVRLLTEPEGGARDLLAVAEGALPTFEALEDDRSLGSGLAADRLRPRRNSRRPRRLEGSRGARARLLPALGVSARQCTRADCRGDLLGADVRVVGNSSDACELLADEAIGYVGRASVIPYVGGLHAQAGRLPARARAHRLRPSAYTKSSGPLRRSSHCGTVRADVELLAGTFAAAERTLREQCEYLERTSDRAHLACGQRSSPRRCTGRRSSTRPHTGRPCRERNAASDDQSAQLILGSVEAKLLAREGDLVEARSHAEETVRLAESTDGLNLIRRYAKLALGEVLRIAGPTRRSRASGHRGGRSLRAEGERRWRHRTLRGLLELTCLA